MFVALFGGYALSYWIAYRLRSEGKWPKHYTESFWPTILGLLAAVFCSIPAIYCLCRWLASIAARRRKGMEHPSRPSE